MIVRLIQHGCNFGLGLGLGILPLGRYVNVNMPWLFMLCMSSAHHIGGLSLTIVCAGHVVVVFAPICNYETNISNTMTTCVDQTSSVHVLA